jgi:hypothetical protein
MDILNPPDVEALIHPDPLEKRLAIETAHEVSRGRVGGEIQPLVRVR